MCQLWRCSIHYHRAFLFLPQGYGNIEVETLTSRRMIYSVGLLSILCFGGVLATAGSFVTAIFEDALVRIRLRFLTTPLVQTTFWAACYYGWMFVIMLVSQYFCHVASQFLCVTVPSSLNSSHAPFSSADSFTTSGTCADWERNTLSRLRMGTGSPTSQPPRWGSGTLFCCLMFCCR